MSIAWEDVRAQFPALKRWTYLNTATFGQLPQAAIDAVAGHFERRTEFACTDFLQWFDDADRIRAQAAELIHCSPDDIAFATNTATALGLFLGGVDWQPGDRVLALAHEFPNNLYAPAALERRGVQFVEADWSCLPEAIQGARAVLASTVNYTTGFRVPLQELSRLCRDAGALLYVDGTQSLGALRFDAAAVRPDMFAVHGYKWLLSPNGAGFFYVAPELRERLEPAVVGWRSHHDWRNVDDLHHGAPQFKRSAEKYEGGMLNFPSLYAMSASLELLLSAGPDAIEGRVLELADKCRDMLTGLGAKVLSGPGFDSPILAASFAGRDPSILAAELKARGVLVTARRGFLRVSTHLYNNEADLQKLSDELQRLLCPA